MLDRVFSGVCPLLLVLSVGCDRSQESLYIPPGPTPSYSPRPALSRPTVLAVGDGSLVEPNPDGVVSLAGGTRYVARLSLDYPPSACRVRMTASWETQATPQDCPAGDDPIARFSFEFTTPSSASYHRFGFAAEKDGTAFAEVSVPVRIVPSDVLAADPEFGISSVREGPRDAGGVILEYQMDGTVFVARNSVYTVRLWVKYPRYATCTIVVIPDWAESVEQRCPGGLEQGLMVEYQFTTPREGTFAGLEFFARSEGDTFATAELAMRLR